VAMPTARTHLAAAFRKTGTRRQAELVRLATLLPGGPIAG
jgi:DNA-binding CsgD family transcriptional regulator